MQPLHIPFSGFRPMAALRDGPPFGVCARLSPVDNKLGRRGPGCAGLFQPMRRHGRTLITEVAEPKLTHDKFLESAHC